MSSAIPAHAAKPTLSTYTSQTMTWRDCGGGLLCSSFKVPMDYTDIDGNTFTLQVVKHPASNQSKKIGTLFVNPGGPGGSAIDYASAAELIVSDAINQRYDIVGFDPRGVGKSQPLRCLTDKEEDQYIASDSAVLNQRDLNNLIASAKLFAKACAKSAGPKIGHYSTLETAKDMEILRGLIKSPKLNYIGKSYGSFLGTLYATLYPTKVGKMVLDGAIDPNATSAQQNLTQAIGFDTALNDYIKKNGAFTKSEIITFLSSLKSKPISLPNGRKLSSSLAIIAIASTLYDNQSGWPDLTMALSEAIRKQNPRPMLNLADDYNRRDANGHYSNENDISQVVSCLDFVDTRSVAQITKDGAQMKKKAPVFGPYLTYAGLSCKYWLHKPLPKPAIKNVKTAPILIIATTKDPATPYEWALKLKKLLPNSTLFTFNGEGHTGHNRGSSCIDSAVDSYLLGATPKTLTCNA